MLYVWHISREGGSSNYETFIEIVVIASDEETARRISPKGDFMTDEYLEEERKGYINFYGSDEEYNLWWPVNIKGLVVKNIGVAGPNQKDREVICASYHPG